MKEIPLFEYEFRGRNEVNICLKDADGDGVGCYFEVPPSDMGGAQKMLDTVNDLIREFNAKEK